MSNIRLNGIVVTNYRSFCDRVTIGFPSEEYKKPVAIVGYNNAGKTNLMNAILYGITEKYVTKDTFSIDDFHNRDINNVPKIITRITSSSEMKSDGKSADLTGWHFLDIETDGSDIDSAKISSYRDYERNDKSWTSFGAAKYFKIFYINFHEIKKEISTRKTSWGNLTSFLSKHIQNLVLSDTDMTKRKDNYRKEIKQSTDKVLENSKLNNFISQIQKNYSKNLRNNNCNIDFGLPEYEEIFLEMIFKIGLNGNTDNLIPIDHFGDGYISMFVMAVIQAIAESNTDDKCLFLFEEPESFLHENHQEYFYKTVLCGLAENGHQVIYTTHSDKMIDIFDTKGLIRVEFDEAEKRTILKYGNTKEEFISEVLVDEPENSEIVSKIKDFNNYIKMIEPNLNKIIFSRKVLLVEGPNDLMVYKELIRRAAYDRCKNDKMAETYLNFSNIAIVPHHGKITALMLIRLCKHLGVEYYVINDFDFKENCFEKLCFDTEEEYKNSQFYNEEINFIESLNSKGEPHSETTKKAMMTTNWKLINDAGRDKIHFNIPKLENLIGYDSNDKNSTGIWNALQIMKQCGEEIFPVELTEFLEISKIDKCEEEENNRLVLDNFA